MKSAGSNLFGRVMLCLLGLFLVGVLDPSSADAQRPRIIDAKLEIPEQGEVGGVEAVVVLHNILDRSIQVMPLDERKGKARKISIKPGETVKVPVIVRVSKGPKDIIELDLKVYESRRMVGMARVQAYARVEKSRWYRSTYRELYIPDPVEIDGKKYIVIPAIGSDRHGRGKVSEPKATKPTPKKTREIRSRQPDKKIIKNLGWNWIPPAYADALVQGDLRLKNFDGIEIPGAGWEVEVVMGDATYHARTNEYGSWVILDEDVSFDGDETAIVRYFPRSDFVVVKGSRAFGSDVEYIFEAQPSTLGSGNFGNHLFDLSSATGVVAGLADVFDHAVKFQAKLKDNGIDRWYDTPVNVFFPNEWNGCFSQWDPWSCSSVNGTNPAIYLAVKHATDFTLYHELSHSLDMLYQPNPNLERIGGHDAGRCYNPVMALSEGFASAMAAFVVGGEDPFVAYHIDKVPDWYCPGETNEGRVAATFWDLVDTAATGPDDDAYSPGPEDPAAAFKAYLNAPEVKRGLVAYLPDLEGLAEDPGQIWAVFRSNTIPVERSASAAGNSEGRNSWISERVGGEDGEAFQSECGYGEVIVGLEVRAGALIDAVRPLCAVIHGESTGRVRVEGPLNGGTGGSLRRLKCPDGSMLYGIDGKSGSYIDSISLQCISLADESTAVVGPAGGDSGFSFQTLMCPDGMLPEAISGKAYRFVDSLQLQCKAPQAMMMCYPENGSSVVWGGPVIVEGVSRIDMENQVIDTLKRNGFVSVPSQGRTGVMLGGDVANIRRIAEDMNLSCENIPPRRKPAIAYSVTTGGPGGTKFVTSCKNDEVMAGLDVYAGSYVDDLIPRCVKVVNGRWEGNPIPWIAAVNAVSSRHWIMDCDRDSSVAGIHGQSAWYVDNLGIICQRLVDGNRVAGDPQVFPEKGGSPWFADDYTLGCPSTLPATGVFGRAGAWVDQVGLVCGER